MENGYSVPILNDAICILYSAHSSLKTHTTPRAGQDGT
jgi:hypothetical protein